MKAIIVGGGKVGFFLAKTLCEKDYDVCVIEHDKEQSRYCANNLEAEIICADGTTAEAFETGGAGSADVVIATMGRDESNLVCCQMAKKQFGVKKTIARVNNPRNADILRELGVDIVVSATDSIMKLLEQEVAFSATKTLIDLDEDNEASILQITLPANYALEGRRLRDLEIPSGCNLACIHRDGKMIIPRGHTMLFSGDVVMVAAMNKEIKDLKKALKIKD